MLPGGSTQGASTITEQFVKNALEAQGSRTVFQKFREAALAYQLERQWDKDKILTEYLNTIYFGEGAYGIEAAARTYFGWSTRAAAQRGHDTCAKDLTPPEAAMLAGIIASPSAFSPRINPQAAMDRRNLVLKDMLDQGDIAETEYNQGVDTQLPAASEHRKPSDESEAPLLHLVAAPAGRRPLWPGRAFGGGSRCTARSTSTCRTRAGDRESTLSGVAPTASVVVLDNETGEVKAMVGGNDFQNHPFNLATNGHRQPGSSFKPFTLATALSQGISPGTSYASNEKIFKVPHSKNEYFDVHNYGDEYYGSSSLETAPSTPTTPATRSSRSGRHCRASGMRREPRGPRRHQGDRAHRPPDGHRHQVLDQPVDGPRRDRPGRQPARDGLRLQDDLHDGERVGGNLDASLGPQQHSLQLAPIAIDKVTDPNGETIAENKPRKIASSRRASPRR